MYRVLALTVCAAMVCSMPARAEEFTGTVRTINVEKGFVELADTGIGEKGSLKRFNLDKLTIHDDIDGKRVPLPNGLKDLRIGDFLVIGSSSTRGLVYVLRQANRKK